MIIFLEKEDPNFANLSNLNYDKYTNLHDNTFLYANAIISEYAENNLSDLNFAFKAKLKEAINEGGDKVLDAIRNELLQMINKKVWKYINITDFPNIKHPSELIPKPIISIMNVSKKFDSFNEFIKWKARLVAGGHMQDRDDILFNEKTSPTISNDALFIMFGYAARFDAHMVTCDIGGAFLESSVPDDMVIYVSLNKDIVKQMIEIDPSLAVHIWPNGQLILQLLKGLYGTVQGARLWYNLLKDVLIEFGFKMHPKDPCFFILIRGGIHFMNGFHVDDLLMICSSMQLINEFTAFLQTKFDTITVCKNDADGISYLGMTIKKHPDFITVQMSGYEEKFLNGYDFPTNLKINDPAGDNIFEIPIVSKMLEESERSMFHTTVCQLLYLAKRTRFELLMAISFLAGRVTNATQSDRSKLIRVLQYLKNHPAKRLYFRKQASPTLSVYIDASWAVHQDCTSRTGVFLIFMGCIIAAYSIKQKLITRSSTESELVGLSDGLTLALWPRAFIEWIENFINNDTKTFRMTVYQDNTACISLQETGQRNNQRTRHLDVRLYWSMELVTLGQMIIKKCHSLDMLSDISTKPKHGPQFHRLVDATRGKTALIPQKVI